MEQVACLVSVSITRDCLVSQWVSWCESDLFYRQLQMYTKIDRENPGNSEHQLLKTTIMHTYVYQDVLLYAKQYCCHLVQCTTCTI